METYVSKSLEQGYIRPSTSPASSSLFFVKMKDGGLRPCFDYRGINQITEVQLPASHRQCYRVNVRDVVLHKIGAYPGGGRV